MRTERRQPVIPIAWVPGSICPCGCGVTGSKLKTGKPCVPGGCVVGCVSPSCRGRRNRRSGRAAQRNMHEALGGTGFSPLHEEARGAYSIEIQVESKQGDQCPQSFSKFVGLEWTRHALDQADRAIAAGVQAHPAIYLQPSGGGRWLVVRLT